MDIKGSRVEKVLVEEKLSIEKEFYLGIIVDRASRAPVAIASASGGMDIEEVARTAPEKVVKKHIDPVKGLMPHEANLMMKKIGLSGTGMLAASQILQKLYRVLKEYDAELTEINPLVLTSDGKLVAADGKLNIDDSSLFRHPEFKEYADMESSSLEARAKKSDLSYVELDGNIGIIGNGAGLVMATLDTVALCGGKAANFCDLGGGSPQDRVAEGIDILLSNPKVKGIFINILGGITRCDDVAKGLVEYRNKKGINIPFVVRMVGTNEAEGKRMCSEAGIEVMPTMFDAAKRIVELTGGVSSSTVGGACGGTCGNAGVGAC